MDQAHVDLLREFYDALNRDDVDPAVQLCDPDVRVWLNPEVVAALPPRGYKEVAKYLRGWFDSWDAYVPRPQEFIDAGDQVVVMVKLRARGKGSPLRDRGGRWRTSSHSTTGTSRSCGCTSTGESRSIPPASAASHFGTARLASR